MRYFTLHSSSISCDKHWLTLWEVEFSNNHCLNACFESSSMSFDHCPFKFNSLAERKVKSYPILYYEIFKWKMGNAPKHVVRFCDASLTECERKLLVKWVRDVDDKTSCQHLQILFSFSIPNPESVNKIKSLEKPIISAGAGNGYWEYLLLENGVDIIAFDSNTIYPEGMHYIKVQKGDPSQLQKFSDRALMLGWPDHDEESSFSVECLQHYSGDTVIHIGELFGESLSNNPWGQTTSKKFQLKLGESFRCVYRMRLPNWPGYLDSLSIWCRASEPVECDGGLFCFVSGLEGRNLYHEDEKEG